MTYHKGHKKKRSLALLLTSALLLGNVPVYASQNVEIDFSSSDSDESKEGTSGTDDAELTIEDTENDLFPNETDSDASTEDTSDPATFSSGEKEATFSSGEDDSDSDEDRDYILGRPMTEEERAAQLAPLQNLVEMAPAPEVDSDIGIATYAALPSKYDSRDYNIVSSVKNQGSLNLCWAFSLASNMETSLLSRGLGSFDLSEEHLAYFWSHRVNDPLENTPNDYIARTTSDYHGSGNGRIASFFLSTWSGMATESKFPLQTSAKNYSPMTAYDTSAYMEDAVFSEYDVTRTKQLIMEYGSVSVMINMRNAYYCTDTAAYSNPAAMGQVNHAVTIVGWDDTYKKSNFNSASAVENDGAWIVKNSYGKNNGKDGYIYLSYEDDSICNLVCNTAITKPDYPNNYFYDGATTIGLTAYTSKSTGAYIPYYASNIFKATAGNGNDEELGEIVTAVAQDNTEFQVQIYTNLNDPSDPTSGTPAYSEPATYTQALSGIHTIKLTDPVKIPANSLYSVVLKLVDGGKYYVEKNVSAGWFNATAGLDANQSFASLDGQTWSDVIQSTTPYCFSIKAHTKTIIPPAPTATPTPSPTPTATPTPVTYQLSYDANISLTTGNLPASVSAVSGQTVTAGAAPYCTSRFFTGWNTQADGKGTSYSPGQSISLTQNTTLYAQWCYGYVSSAKLRYRVTGKQTVTCYGTTNSKIRSVSIPATITYKDVTYKVTTVWTGAFKNKTKLTSVSIGNNVSIIGNNAFYNCKNLKKVTIGTGLTRINTNAFRNVKTGCIITIKSQKLKTVTSKIDSSVKKMTVRVPRKKYSVYRKLLRKKSKSVIIKKY